MLPVSGAEQLNTSLPMIERPTISASGAYSRLVSPAPQSPCVMKRFHSPCSRAFSFSSRMTGGSSCGLSASASCASYTASAGVDVLVHEGLAAGPASSAVRAENSKSTKLPLVRVVRMVAGPGQGALGADHQPAMVGGSRSWSGSWCRPSRCRRRLWPMIAAILIRPRASNQARSRGSRPAVGVGVEQLGRRRAGRATWRPTPGSCVRRRRAGTSRARCAGRPTLQISQSISAAGSGAAAEDVAEPEVAVHQDRGEGRSGTAAASAARSRSARAGARAGRRAWCGSTAPARPAGRERLGRRTGQRRQRYGVQARRGTRRLGACGPRPAPVHGGVVEHRLERLAGDELHREPGRLAVVDRHDRRAPAPSIRRAPAAPAPGAACRCGRPVAGRAAPP